MFLVYLMWILLGTHFHRIILCKVEGNIHMNSTIIHSWCEKHQPILPSERFA